MKTHVVRAACLECRRRKARCSGAAPCKTCLSRGLTCEFVKHHRGGARHRRPAQYDDFVRAFPFAPAWPPPTQLMATMLALTKRLPTDEEVVASEDSLTDDVAHLLLHALLLFSRAQRTEAMQVLERAVELADYSGHITPTLVELWINDKMFHAFCGRQTCLLPFKLHQPEEIVEVVDTLRRHLLGEKDIELPAVIGSPRAELYRATIAILMDAPAAQLQLPFLIQSPACGLLRDDIQGQGNLAALVRCLEAADSIVDADDPDMFLFQRSCSLSLAIVVHANAVTALQRENARERLRQGIERLRDLRQFWYIADCILDRLDLVLQVVEC
ncbi:hypothetical protein PYCC9005_002102 [Savitreella phatthalungensis]